MCRKIKCVCVNFDFIEFGGMTQRKFWYGLWCRSTSFTCSKTLIVDRSSELIKDVESLEVLLLFLSFFLTHRLITQIAVEQRRVKTLSEA